MTGLWSLYRWFYTGDGNAPDENYNNALNQAWTTLRVWTKHFAIDNGAAAPVTATVVGPLPKAVPIALGLARNIRPASSSWATSGLRVAAARTRSPILVPAARITKGSQPELWIIAEAFVAWAAAIQKLNDPQNQTGDDNE